MAVSSMVVLRLPTPSLIVHALERSWYQARHAWSLHVAFSLVFVSCVFLARVPSCFVVAASNLVSLYDLSLASARVSSRFVVESHLSSPFIVFPTLCGHATSNSNILLSCSRQPSYC